MISARRICALVLLASAASPFAPAPASAAIAASASVLAGRGYSAGAVEPARLRRDPSASRHGGLRPRQHQPIRRARGSGNPVYSNIRPNATLPLSIMVPEPGIRQPPPSAAQIAPARVLPPVGAVQRFTIVPQSVTPNPETFNDRVVRCTHAAGVNGISPGQQGAYVSNCTM